MVSRCHRHLSQTHDGSRSLSYELFYLRHGAKEKREYLSAEVANTVIAPEMVPLPSFIPLVVHDAELFTILTSVESGHCQLSPRESAKSVILSWTRLYSTFIESHSSIKHCTAVISKTRDFIFAIELLTSRSSLPTGLSPESRTTCTLVTRHVVLVQSDLSYYLCQGFALATIALKYVQCGGNNPRLNRSKPVVEKEVYCNRCGQHNATAIGAARTRAGVKPSDHRPAIQPRRPSSRGHPTDRNQRKTILPSRVAMPRQRLDYPTSLAYQLKPRRKFRPLSRLWMQQNRSFKHNKGDVHLALFRGDYHLGYHRKTSPIRDSLPSYR
ncbi:hypothetical protein J6590_027891 [Homalodisca vitripennis]|nr:hypothetical protein J6590_027891 [Homalodisca vitripennis]